MCGRYHSCGQFSNVLHATLHALALSKLLCRTLILPGFFVRRGRRLTRVSPFEEAWLPTSHFLNLSAMRASFDVVEMHEWAAGEGAAGEAAARRAAVPRLHARAVANAPAQLRLYRHFNLSVGEAVPATYPHLLQQQTELRWVSDDAERRGYFTAYAPGRGAAFWRAAYGDGAGGAGGAGGASSAAAPPVLAFDASPSLGMYMDSLRWDEALRYTRGHVRYRGAVFAEARRYREAAFGADGPYLGVHIRRGADYLHDFCETAWGQRAFGWNISMGMCYPPAAAVAAQILAAEARWGVPHGHVLLATDSPLPELFEDVLRAHGVAFGRYGQPGGGGPPPALGAEYALPVDQTLCASAPFFLGNVPSTVTAAIVQERDAIGWGRERTSFFGFGDAQLAQFRGGWAAADDFAAHYAPGGAGGACAL